MGKNNHLTYASLALNPQITNKPEHSKTHNVSDQPAQLHSLTEITGLKLLK